MYNNATAIAQSAQRLATGRTVQGSNPGGCEISVASGPALGPTQAPPTGKWSLSRAQSGQDTALNTHPHRVPRLKKE